MTNKLSNLITPNVVVCAVIALTFVCAFWIVGGDLLSGTAHVDMSALRHIGR
jgi:hypothetical protein